MNQKQIVTVLLNIFKVFYLVFSVSILMIYMGYSTFNIIMVSLCAIIIFAYISIRKKTSKWRINEKFLYIVIGLGFILHIILLLLRYSIPISDYATFFVGASEFASGTLDNPYMNVFPHLYPYVVWLGSIFKFLGVSYFNVVLNNIFFDIIGTICFYYIFAILKDKKAGLLASALWICNPFNLVWATVCAPIAMYNNCLVICVLAFVVMMKKCKNKKMFLGFSAITGILIGIANLYRPITIILIIAIAIYYLYDVLNTKNKKSILYISSIVLMLLGSSLIGTINKTYLENEFNIDIPKSTFGWNVYVGSDLSSKGQWSEELSADFSKQLEKKPFDANRIQDYFLKEGIKKFKLNGVNNVELFADKFKTLVKSTDEYTFYTYKATVLTQVSFLDKVLKLGLTMMMSLLLISQVISAFLIKNNENMRNVFIAMLCIVGVLISHLFVEVSPRYAIPLLVPFIVLFIINMLKIENNELEH